MTVDTTSHEHNTQDRGPWMLTRYGHQFYPLSPRIEDFHIEEIGESLSKTCRYNGHTPYFYSVAEHCVILGNYFLRKGQLNNARWAWAHDGAESYIGDMIRPIKWMFPNFQEIEQNIEKVFFYDFLNLKGSFSNVIKAADSMICNDERFQLWMNVRVPETNELVIEKYNHNKSDKLGIKIHYWTPEEASRQYIHMYKVLFDHDDGFSGLFTFSETL